MSVKNNAAFRVSAFILLGMGVVLLDFVTKAAVYHLLPFINYSPAMYPYGGIGIFENFLGIECSISLAINRGAAWGIFSEYQHLLLAVRVLVILGMLFYVVFVNKTRSATLPFVLVISGAFGNVIDYFLYGYVIDFIHFKFWGWDFPVFNVADVAITLGVIWLFVLAFLGKKRAQNA